MRHKLAGSMATVLFILGFTLSAQAEKWRQGDILVGTGSGHWLVFRPSTGTVVDTLSDTDGVGAVANPGATGASASDNTWHPVTTDSGANDTQALLVRFKLSPHDQTSTPAVLSTIDVGNLVSGFAKPVALAVKGDGSLIVGSAVASKIAVVSGAGALVRSYALTNQQLDRALGGIDVSVDGTKLYYVSGGSTIRALTLSSGVVSTLNSLGGHKLLGIHVIPAGGFPSLCNGSTTCPA